MPARKARYRGRAGLAPNRRLRQENAALRRSHEQMALRQQEIRMLPEGIPDAVVRYDRDCRRTYVSQIYAALSGMEPEALLGKTPLQLWPMYNVPAADYQAMLRRVLDGEAGVTTELEWLDADGRRFCFSLVLVPEYDRDAHICSVLAIGRNTSAIRAAQDLLRQREQEFRTLVENSPDTIGRYDRQLRRVYANPRLLRSLGGDPARVLGSTPAELPGGAMMELYMDAMREVLAHGEARSVELRWSGDDGEQCAQIRLTPEFDHEGALTHVLAVGRDITQIDRYRREVHQQAYFDNLTGLPNRLQLSDTLTRVVADTVRRGEQCGLMFLDLDHFKEVNDTLGHDCGDALLREAARRMRLCVRQHDMVARLGGDEFAILLSHVRRREDLSTIAAKILAQLAEPFRIHGHELFVTGSIGVALAPGDSCEVDVLYKYADSAMYHAKKMGRNNFQFYTVEFFRRALDRMEIETALRLARQRDELVLYFQPQIDLPSGRLIGAEALLRWDRPGHGMVMPERFIAVAEESNLMVGLGEWVLRRACATVAEWNRGRARPLKVAVNLSPRQFLRNDLPASVRAVLADTGCRPEWLELEITESLLLEDSAEVIAMLEALHAMGLSISLDDFGTGYSSLGYLSRFPVGQIKLDRSFVSGIPAQRDKCELVKAMLSIATALGLDSVAEGVETADQAEYLLAHGCRLAQGYLFGRPMPRADFEAVLAAQSAPG